MRIISGTARGRRLFTPSAKEDSIRPTSDRAREALFNILGNRVRNATVLDLFAGTGAFGLEAFSRDASHVVFVDNSQLAINLIKKNILLCLKGNDSTTELRVIRQDLSKPLSLKKLPDDCLNGFDIIFADPPYGKKLSHNTLKFVNNSSLLKQNGILIVEERHDIVLPNRLSSLELLDRRNYGETGFYLYQVYG